MNIQDALDLIDNLRFADNITQEQSETLEQLRDVIEREQIQY